MKKEHYLLLGGAEPISWITVDRDSMLVQFRQALQCTCVESAPCRYDVLLLVDACGLIRRRPFNLLASCLYPGSFYGSPIFGPAIVAYSGFVDGEPDWVPLSSCMLPTLEKILRLPIPPCPEGGAEK